MIHSDVFPGILWSSSLREGRRRPDREGEREEGGETHTILVEAVLTTILTLTDLILMLSLSFLYSVYWS